MPKPTLEELKQNLRKTNDDFHKAMNDILSSEQVIVEHKADVGCLADRIFASMGELNAFMDSL